MKKQIFTLLILIGLVGFSSKLFAQAASTALTPSEGATHTYVVTGLSNNDIVTMGVSANATGYDNVLPATIVSSSTLTPSGGVVTTDLRASLQVLWGAEAANAGDNYYVWIRIEDATSHCYTYRAIEVNPQDFVDYDVEFSVVALEPSSTTTAGEITGMTPDTDDLGVCADSYSGSNLLQTAIDGTTNDGYTYAYFRVTRVADGSLSSAWTFTPNGTDGLTWAISTNSAGSFTNYTDNTAQIVPSTVDVVYLRATVPAATDQQNITLNIGTPLASDAGGLATDILLTNNEATLEISPLPTVAPNAFGTSF